MGLYAQPSGSDIGSLLRLIQEQESSSLAKAQPQADVSAPMRDVVQEPLKGPESPGTATVVSQRPEGVGVPIGTSITPARASVGPVNIGGPGDTGQLPTPGSTINPSMPFSNPSWDVSGPSNPTTGSASGDWAKYHGGGGVMPEGYAGEGGGQPRNAPQSYSAPSQPQSQPQQTSQPTSNGVVLGTQIKSSGPSLKSWLNSQQTPAPVQDAAYWNEQTRLVNEEINNIKNQPSQLSEIKAKESADAEKKWNDYLDSIGQGTRFR